jgi:hypothetical protein
LGRRVHEPDNFRNLLLSYGSLSVLVFILFQVLQVVVAAIPGEFVNRRGLRFWYFQWDYLFSFWYSLRIFDCVLYSSYAVSR